MIKYARGKRRCELQVTVLPLTLRDEASTVDRHVPSFLCYKQEATNMLTNYSKGNIRLKSEGGVEDVESNKGLSKE